MPNIAWSIAACAFVCVTLNAPDAKARSLSEISADTPICWSHFGETIGGPLPNEMPGGDCDVYASCNDVQARTNGFSSELEYMVIRENYPNYKSSFNPEMSDCSEFKGASTGNTCKSFDADRLVGDAKTIFGFACNNNLTFSMNSYYPYEDLARTLKDEDGVTPLIRTGHEVALFKRVKHRLVNAEVFPEPIPMRSVFVEAVYAIAEQKRGSNFEQTVEINIVDAFLTVRNVMIILARSEQWFTDFPMTPAGQNRRRQDQARGIFLDLLGEQSVDEYPTTLQFLGWRRFDPNSLPEVFFGKSGVVEFFPEAGQANDGFPPAHWNAGIHYYFWIGSLGRWLSDLTTPVPIGGLGPLGAGIYERAQKLLGGNPLRGTVQVGLGFDDGAAQAARLFTSLEEIKSVFPAMVK